MMMLRLIAIGCGVGAGAASFQPESINSSDGSESVQADSDAGTRALFPNLRINTEERWLEFDGFVPIDVNDPDAPLVYLEQFVCGRESPEIAAGKEHESLVATNAKGSHIHAGLLLLGLEPGSPVKWETLEDGSIQAIAPTGPAVRMEFLVQGAEGETLTVEPQDWVRHAESRERFPAGNWVFSGSIFVDYGAGEVYDADRSGTLVGLSAFGGEVLSWNSAIHHDSGVAAPVWSANNETVPAFKTPVRVRLHPIEVVEPEAAANGPVQGSDSESKKDSGDSDPSAS